MHQGKRHHWSRRSSRCWPARSGPSSVWVSDGFIGHSYTCKQRYTSSKNLTLHHTCLFFSNMYWFFHLCFLNMPLFAELQGVSWEGPTDDSRPVTEEPIEEEPLYTVPRKDHQPKFTIDDFVLHKMLGKGSFGKVLEVI